MFEAMCEEEEKMTLPLELEVALEMKRIRESDDPIRENIIQEIKSSLTDGSMLVTTFRIDKVSNYPLMVKDDNEEELRHITNIQELIKSSGKHWMEREIEQWSIKHLTSIQKLHKKKIGGLVVYPNLNIPEDAVLCSYETLTKLMVLIGKEKLLL